MGALCFFLDSWKKSGIPRSHACHITPAMLVPILESSEYSVMNTIIAVIIAVMIINIIIIIIIIVITSEER